MEIKHLSQKNYITIAVLAAIAALVAYVLFAWNWQAPPNSETPDPGSGFVSNTTVAQHVPEAPGLPALLTIPTIKVNAKVVYLGLAKDGSIGAPTGPYNVAWFKLGPRPGEKGSAIITGHFGPWRSGASSVFDNLNKLKAGDKIYIKDDKGKQLTFQVRETKKYSPNESPEEVFADDGMHLNLITCQGQWISSQKTYTQRLVVFTDLVVPDPVVRK